MSIQDLVVEMSAYSNGWRSRQSAVRELLPAWKTILTAYALRLLARMELYTLIMS